MWPDRPASRSHADCGAICFRAGLVSLAWAATSIIFVTTNTRLSRQTRLFVTTEVCLRQNTSRLCRDRNICSVSVVAIKDTLLQQTCFVATNMFIATEIILSRQNTKFVVTKDAFVATKIMLVAVPATILCTQPWSRWLHSLCATTWSMSVRHTRRRCVKKKKN